MITLHTILIMLHLLELNSDKIDQIILKMNFILVCDILVFLCCFTSVGAGTSSLVSSGALTTITVCSWKASSRLMSSWVT